MRRLVRLGLVLLILPGGLIVGAGLIVLAVVMRSVRAADPEWSPDFRVLFWARFWTAVYGVPMSLALSILHNEGASVARPLRPREVAELVDPPEVGYPVGDLGDSRGPSVGPGQVLRMNVVRLWADPPAAFAWLVVKSDPTELVKPENTAAAMWVSVKVMAECLRASGGDLREAARRYNGSGSAAEAYADRAAAFIDELGKGAEPDSAGISRED